MLEFKYSPEEYTKESCRMCDKSTTDVDLTYKKMHSTKRRSQTCAFRIHSNEAVQQSYEHKDSAWEAP